MSSDSRADGNSSSRQTGQAAGKRGLPWRLGAAGALTRLLFYGAIAPIGVGLRLAGWDPLRRRRDPAALSYWIERRPSRPPQIAMRRQF